MSPDGESSSLMALHISLPLDITSALRSLDMAKLIAARKVNAGHAWVPCSEDSKPSTSARDGAAVICAHAAEPRREIESQNAVQRSICCQGPDHVSAGITCGERMPLTSKVYLLRNYMSVGRLPSVGGFAVLMLLCPRNLQCPDTVYALASMRRCIKFQVAVVLAASGLSAGLSSSLGSHLGSSDCGTPCVWSNTFSCTSAGNIDARRHGSKQQRAARRFLLGICAYRMLHVTVV